MLHDLTKLKITTVHCEHLSTQLVTGDGREDALVRPGYKLSMTILNMSTVVYTQLIVKCKIVLYGRRPWKRLCSHSGSAMWWQWWFKYISCTWGWLGSRVVSVRDSANKRAWVQIAAAMLSGNSLRQTVHNHCASVHQAAKLVAAFLRVARVTPGLEKSNGSLRPGLWLTLLAGWLPRTGISSGTLCSEIEYGLPLPFYIFHNTRWCGSIVAKN